MHNTAVFLTFKAQNESKHILHFLSPWDNIVALRKQHNNQNYTGFTPALWI